MQNKERFMAEQSAILRGYVAGQKKSSSMLKMIATVRLKVKGYAKSVHDDLNAKYICKHYID